MGQCAGNAASCTSTACCEAYPTCDTYACPESWINGGVLTTCTGTDITGCTKATCCTEPATCDTSKDCADPTPVNKGSGTYCVGVCNSETCCSVDVGPTCFPGEAHVSTEHGFAQRLDSIQPGTQVFVGEHFEPVLGLLHTPEEATSLH